MADRFKLITQGGDRHGVFEWAFYLADDDEDGVDRLITIGVIPSYRGETAELEFWFGARFENRYVRLLASRINMPLHSDETEPVAAALRNAVENVESITRDDLVESLPRTP